MYYIRPKLKKNTMQAFEKLRADYLAYAAQQHFQSYQPRELYEPLDYILSLGGKHMRPILLLSSSRLFDENNIKISLPAAYAIELFHNFSLIHDDIMDNASVRRGKATVHEKYGSNTAILSGDVMLVHAYQYLTALKTERLQQILQIFNETAIGVCEGQQMDMNFEKLDQVSVASYIRMIELKTSVLLYGAMKIGALLSTASENDAENIAEFGRNMGIAFQLQDDYLDSFGDENTFGKRIGGDIVQNKKTYLYIKALAMAPETDRKIIFDWYSKDVQTSDEDRKIEEVKSIFMSSGAVDALEREIENYKNKALSAMSGINAAAVKKQELIDFLHFIMKRQN
jgi:geranylgeranyl diphosphate synthase type II